MQEILVLSKRVNELEKELDTIKMKKETVQLDKLKQIL